MTLKETALTLTTEEKTKAIDCIELAYSGNKDAVEVLSGLFDVKIKTLKDIWNINKALLVTMVNIQKGVEYNKLKQRLALSPAPALDENKILSKIAIARMQIGLSQSQLAKLADMSIRTLQGYEQGRKDLSKAASDTVLRLADALNIDIRELIG